MNLEEGALEGVFRWVVFPPSRRDSRVPVPNRYFGVFRDGSLKYRGIEARRHDTPPWVSQTQLAVLDCLADMHYDGWIVVEQDVLPGMGEPKKCAKNNREFIKSLGL